MLTPNLSTLGKKLKNKTKHINLVNDSYTHIHKDRLMMST